MLEARKMGECEDLTEFEKRQTDDGQTPGSEHLLNISHFPNITNNITDQILSRSFSSDFV